MRYLLSPAIIIASIISGSGNRTIIGVNNFLDQRKVSILSGCFNAHGHLFVAWFTTFYPDFTTQLNNIIVYASLFEKTRHHIHAVTLGNTVGIELYAGFSFHQFT